MNVWFGERSRPSPHRTYPTRQSGQVTNCSGTLGQWTPLARVASEARGNGASASIEAEVGLGCMDSMVSICNSCKRRKFQGAEDALRSSRSGYDGSEVPSSWAHITAGV